MKTKSRLILIIGIIFFLLTGVILWSDFTRRNKPIARSDQNNLGQVLSESSNTNEVLPEPENLTDDQTDPEPTPTVSDVLGVDTALPTPTPTSTPTSTPTPTPTPVSSGSSNSSTPASPAPTPTPTPLPIPGISKISFHDCTHGSSCAGLTTVDVQGKEFTDDARVKLTLGGIELSGKISGGNGNTKILTDFWNLNVCSLYGVVVYFPAPDPRTAESTFVYDPDKNCNTQTPTLTPTPTPTVTLTPTATPTPSVSPTPTPTATPTGTPTPTPTPAIPSPFISTVTRTANVCSGNTCNTTISVSGLNIAIGIWADATTTVGNSTVIKSAATVSTPNSTSLTATFTGLSKNKTFDLRIFYSDGREALKTEAFNTI